MALVTKNDITQIFAIQAPSIDLPPTFANYPRGWDTARSNNGKPTIKQFNYLQQRTDQNVLWIHQNGAALPYDATMEYAENAHVVKDGELQKKQGASWVSATNKGYNLDYFVSGKSYPLHAEIMLTNGDIVKSTIPNNINDPNTDMTGWIKTNDASFVVDGDKNQKQINAEQADINVALQNKVKELVSVKDYGAKGDGITDDSSAFNEATLANPNGRVYVPPGIYNLTSAVDLRDTEFDISQGVVAIGLWGNLSMFNNYDGAMVGYTSPKNKIINGSFDVWQRGTVFNSPVDFAKLADRWNLSFNGTSGVTEFSRYAVDTSVYSQGFTPKHAMRCKCTTPATGNTFYDLSTQIEGVRTLAGQTVTISFWAASLSGASKLAAIITEQYYGSGGGYAPEFNTEYDIQLTPGWERHSVTFDLHRITGKVIGTVGDDTLNVIFRLPLNTLFDLVITNVQIEAGNIATSYEYKPPAQTMQECQRYHQTSYSDGIKAGSITTEGALAFTQVAAATLMTIPMKVPMRVSPNITYYNPSTGSEGSWNGQGTALPVATNTSGTKHVTVSTSGGTPGSFCTGHFVFDDPHI